VAATLPQQEKNNSADLQRKRSIYARVQLCIIWVCRGRCPRRLSLVLAGTRSWCSGRCRGAATLSQQEKNKSVELQRKSVNFTRVKRHIFQARIIMAAANCSPAVANRRAKYVGDFRVPTLVGA
jgi:hypothetical protein